jgi:hypothetical protein
MIAPRSPEACSGTFDLHGKARAAPFHASEPMSRWAGRGLVEHRAPGSPSLRSPAGHSARPSLRLVRSRQPERQAWYSCAVAYRLLGHVGVCSFVALLSSGCSSKDTVEHRVDGGSGAGGTSAQAGARTVAAHAGVRARTVRWATVTSRRSATTSRPRQREPSQSLRALQSRSRSSSQDPTARAHCSRTTPSNAGGIAAWARSATGRTTAMRSETTSCLPRSGR